MSYCEMRWTLFLPWEDRRFEYHLRQGFFEETAEGKAYHSSANMLYIKIRAVPGRNRPSCSDVDWRTLTHGSFQLFLPHSRAVHKQEHARAELICNTDQKEIPALKFLMWFFFLTLIFFLLSCITDLSLIRGQWMYVLLCWKLASSAETFQVHILWCTLVGTPIKIIEEKHAQVS